MQTIVLLVNFFLVWYMWKFAKEEFKNNKPVYGWVAIFLSALNAVAIALEIF